MHELFDVLFRHADVSPDRLAFDDGATQLARAPLARRVVAAAEDIRALSPSPPVIGVLGGNSVEWVVALLAGWHAGKTVVPLPPFFRAPQLRHVIEDAGIRHLLATPDMFEQARLLGLPVTPVTAREATSLSAPEPGAAQVIYTSGSTGQPKGVLLDGVRMLWSARALAGAVSAREDDSYLSALPLAILLETISAVLIPLLVGAPVRLDPDLAAHFEAGDDAGLAAAVAAHQPSCMVIVPHLLARWTAALRESGGRAPGSLRFVAVGGAAVQPDLAQQAWDLGIPVYEGYGLSECGSVVALNRSGDRKPGTVGRPLSGLDVVIEDGEIVVRGPSVMDHYLHGAPTGGVCRTGDVGAFDADGRLVVRGRLDNLIVTPIGRNISPEWIESLFLADERIAHCVVAHFDGPHLTAFLVPTPRWEKWFAGASMEDVSDLVAEHCHDVPVYAVPRQFVVMPAEEFERLGLMTGNGRIRRNILLDVYAALAGHRDEALQSTKQRVFGW